MDFSLTQEQNEIVALAKRFADERIAPYYRQRDEEGKFDRATIREMGQLGFFGVEFPEESGGLGLDCLTAGLVLEALSGADYNLAYVPVTISLAGQMMRNHGKPEVVGPWLERMLSGEAIPSVALTEPAGGSDAARLSLAARREGDHYVLTGEKTSISMATQSDVLVVFARTGDAASGSRGVSAFVVPTDDPTITRTAFDDHGGRSATRGTLHFDGTRVPVDHMLGEENSGFSQVMAGFDYSRALIGLQSLAVARVSLDETWRYVGERQAFGKPIVEHQGVSFPLAEAETYYESARLLCLQTLWLKDQGLAHTSQAAMAKWWAPKVAYDAVMACLLTHGHGGYSKDLPFEQRLRDILGLHIGDGMAQIMKTIITRRRMAAITRS